MVSELAREIIAQSKPQDRPSKVCIDIFYGGHRVLNISTPIMRGALIVRICFTQGGGSLQYDAVTNLEGASRSVEGAMRSKFSHHRHLANRFDAAMLALTDSDGNPQSRELFRWHFDEDRLPESEKEVPLFEKIHSILKTLLVV